MVWSETSDNTHSGAGQLGRDKFKISRPGTLASKIVRKYKPKTNRGKADGGLMKRAVEEVMKGLSFRQVARDLNINKITLSRYVKTPKAGLANYEDEFTPNFNARQVFTKEEEEGLEEIEDTK